MQIRCLNKLPGNSGCLIRVDAIFKYLPCGYHASLGARNVLRFPYWSVQSWQLIHSVSSNFCPNIDCPIKPNFLYFLIFAQEPLLYRKKLAERDWFWATRETHTHRKLTKAGLCFWFFEREVFLVTLELFFDFWFFRTEMEHPGNIRQFYWLVIFSLSAKFATKKVEIDAQTSRLESG